MPRGQQWARPRGQGHSRAHTASRWLSTRNARAARVRHADTRAFRSRPRPRGLCGCRYCLAGPVRAAPRVNICGNKEGTSVGPWHPHAFKCLFSDLSREGGPPWGPCFPGWGSPPSRP